MQQSHMAVYFDKTLSYSLLHPLGRLRTRLILTFVLLWTSKLIKRKEYIVFYFRRSAEVLLCISTSIIYIQYKYNTEVLPFN